jgi:predicted nucleic acid-binding protein
VPLRLLKNTKISSVQCGALLAAIAALVANAKVVNINEDKKICRDPNDDHVLACCNECS